jgi:hypothetical protein
VRTGIVLALIALLGQSPPHPDFSGRWILDSPSPASADAALKLTIEQPITRTNVRGEPIAPACLRITIRRETVSSVTTETRVIGAIGGVVEGPVVRDGRSIPGPETRFEDGWRDGSLVFSTSGHDRDGPQTGDWFERSESWSLEPDGRLRVETVSEGRDQPKKTTVLVYRREL